MWWAAEIFSAACLWLLVVLTGAFEEDPPAYRYGAFDDADVRMQRHAVWLLGEYRPACAEAALVHLIERSEGYEPEEGDEPPGEDELTLIAEARALLKRLRAGA